MSTNYQYKQMYIEFWLYIKPVATKLELTKIIETIHCETSADCYNS